MRSPEHVHPELVVRFAVVETDSKVPATLCRVEWYQSKPWPPHASTIRDEHADVRRAMIHEDPHDIGLTGVCLRAQRGVSNDGHRPSRKHVTAWIDVVAIRAIRKA